MNKLQAILPAKRLTLIQNIVTVILMLVIVIMSFGTTFTAHIEKDANTTEIFNTIVNDFGNEDPVEIPDEVDISTPFLLKSFGSIAKIMKSGMETLKNAMDLSDSAQQAQNDINSGNSQNAENDVDDLNEKADKTMDGVNNLADAFKSEEFVGLITLIIVIGQAFAESFILGVVYMALIGLTLALPVIAIIRLIIAIVALFKNLNEPGKGFTTISKSFGGIFVMLPVLWLIKIMAPEVSLGSAITGILVLCLVTLVLNLVASRLKVYTPAQFKYLNVLQGISLVSVIGYFLFMLNIGKMEMFDAIWSKFGSFLKTTGVCDMLITVLLILFMIVLLFFTCKYIQKIACRLCCMVPAGKVLAHDTYLAHGILGLILLAIPMYLMFGNFGLDLGDGMIAFVLFAIGLVIMFATEILMITLKKTVCATATAKDIHAVLIGCPTGIATTEDADANKTEKAEDAPAEEAVATEATTEEVPAEEAAEEVVAEEVTDESAVVIEEVTAEEPATEQEVASEDTTSAEVAESQKYEL